MAAVDSAAAAAALEEAMVQEDAETGPFVRSPLDFSKSLMSAVKQCVQAANRLPSESEFEYLASMLPPGKMQAVRAKLSATIESLASAYGTEIGVRPQADTDDAMERLVDMTDHIIEDVDDCVDQIKRINRYAGKQANYTYKDPQ